MERRIGNKKNNQGFALIEMLVAVFVFALIMTTIVSAFAASFKSQKYSQRLQRDSENIRVAMENMAKSIRTSNLDYPSSVGEADEIYIFDYSQKKCIGYRFVDAGSGKKTLEFKQKNISRLNAAGTDIVNCRDALLGDSFNDFIGDTELYFSKFYVRSTTKESAPSAGDGHMGQVTVVMQLENDLAPFETAVSLRDY